VEKKQDVSENDFLLVVSETIASAASYEERDLHLGEVSERDVWSVSMPARHEATPDVAGPCAQAWERRCRCGGA